MLYIFKQDDAVKVGYTMNPKTRLSDIQVASPIKLEPLLLVDGDREDESNLHDFFSTSRIRGEWFEYSDEVKQYVANNLHRDRRWEFELIPDDYQYGESNQIKRVRMTKNLTAHQVGCAMGVTQQSMSRIERDENEGRVSIKTMRRMAEALGMKFEYRFTDAHDQGLT